MKSKKIKLQLNKETIANLNELEMSMINGGEANFSFLCTLTKPCVTVIHCTALTQICDGNSYRKCDALPVEETINCIDDQQHIDQLNID